ncbi:MULTISPECIES: hypothetical protein [Xanthomonas]|uniref:hypothetical protein n=1 Tax=Xanthomonas TaxID=338 RepID=UPI0012697DCF|nr:hypothetical protein [Xanthomonas arboricola]MCW1981604.1 hypothetical protein [Xanthomonas campestris]MCW2006939.1 hypothetical protein [Xanthomonas campestris]
MDDVEIGRLLKVPKQVVNPKAKEKIQKGSRQLTYDLLSNAGEHFRLIKRQNLRVDDDFSCGLLYDGPNGESMMLTRYNGSSHFHSNPLQDAPPSNMECHIHIATARYIALGRKAEHFAEKTDRYWNVDGALSALVLDCNITGLTPSQYRLIK